MDTIILQICDLAKECGSSILNAHRDNMHITSKAGSANFVTEYDTAIQERLRKGLKNIVPSAQFIGEEGDYATESNDTLFFIVDPIDGTTNFIRDLHASCISIALVDNDAVQIGVVYNPYTDEMFYAKRGAGAFCNHHPIHVSCQPLSNGIVLVGTSPYNRELGQETFKLAYEYFQKSLDIRRSGSAAIDLCSVACGRAELYFELHLSPWDYAAGSLIVEEAGGVVTTMDGGPLSLKHPCSLLAKNK